MITHPAASMPAVLTGLINGQQNTLTQTDSREGACRPGQCSDTLCPV